jgi:hypothetical protein
MEGITSRRHQGFGGRDHSAASRHDQERSRSVGRLLNVCVEFYRLIATERDREISPPMAFELQFLVGPFADRLQ